MSAWLTDLPLEHDEPTKERPARYAAGFTTAPAGSSLEDSYQSAFPGPLPLMVDMAATVVAGQVSTRS